MMELYCEHGNIKYICYICRPNWEQEHKKWQKEVDESPEAKRCIEQSEEILDQLLENNTAEQVLDAFVQTVENMDLEDIK